MKSRYVCGRGAVAFVSFLAMVGSIFGGPAAQAAGFQFVFTTGPSSVTDVACTQYTITRETLNGTIANAPTGGLTINLTGAGSGKFYTSSSCGTSTTSITMAGGASTASFWFKDSAIQSGLSLTATDNSTSPATTGSINVAVTTSAATTLSFGQQPTPSATAGVALPAVTVAVTDGAGNTVTTYTTAIKLGLNSGTLQGTTSVTPVNGVATFSNISVNTAASGYQLTPTSGSLTGAASSAFTVSAAAPWSIVFTSAAQTVNANACSAPATIQLLDQYGNNAVAGTNGLAVTLQSSVVGAVLSFSSKSDCSNSISGGTIPSGAGSATFYFSSAKSGSATMSALASNIQTGSQTETILSLNPTQLAFLNEPGNSTAGAAIPSFQVALEDSNGNVVSTSTATVSLTLNGPTTALQGTTSVAASSGIATFSNVSVNLAGSGYTLSAASGTLTGTTSTPAFSVSAAGAYQVAFSTSAQTVNAGACSAPVTLQVQDKFGNNTTVTNSISVVLASSGAASLSFYSDAACANAIASNTGTLSAGQGSATFYFKGTGSGTSTLSATPSGMSQVSQVETINNVVPLAISTTSLPGGTVSTAYSATVAATGGKTPYTFSISSGSLPAGLTIAGATGVISGTPTTAATSNFTVKVVDSSSPQQSATQALSIVVGSSLASNYFVVAPTGKDTNPGTLASPFATLNQCQTAMRGSTSTKTCYIRGGTYAVFPTSGQGQLKLLTINSGYPTQAALIVNDAVKDEGTTYSYYPPDGPNTAIFDGGDSRTGTNAYCERTDYLTYGIYIGGVSHVTINGLTLQHFTFGGILVHGGQDNHGDWVPTGSAGEGSADYVTIENNIVQNINNGPNPDSKYSNNTDKCPKGTQNGIPYAITGWPDSANQDNQDGGMVAAHGPLSNLTIANNVGLNMMGTCMQIEAGVLGDNLNYLNVHNNYCGNSGTMSHDVGALHVRTYVNGPDTNETNPSTGAMITNNYFRDCGASVADAEPGSSHCIYIDDLTNGITVTGNVMAGSFTTAAFIAHGGNTNSWSGNIVDMGDTATRQYIGQYQDDNADCSVGGSLCDMANNVWQQNIIITSANSLTTEGGYDTLIGTGINPLTTRNDLTYVYPVTGKTGSISDSGAAVTGKDPLLSGWNYMLGSGSPAASSPVNYSQPAATATEPAWGQTGFWGPPGWPIPTTTTLGWSPTPPSCPH